MKKNRQVPTSFEITRVSGAPVSDEELLNDLKSVSFNLKNDCITQCLYKNYGKYDCSTHIKRFGTWNLALESAGLKVSNTINYSIEYLFENILRLWTYYGRQPRRSDLANENSKVSQSPYNRRFGSWGKSLEAFVEYANAKGIDNVDQSVECDSSQRIIGRDPSLRLRYKVLKRDNFSCQACGVSPARELGIELHVDHVVPWSKNGETILENLQTLCSKCNLGKSNHSL